MESENGEIVFREEIWSELRRWMFKNVFNRKCAYCEGKVEPQSWGAAEHWRPKGGVSELKDGAYLPVARDGERHPGYYWLAYDWRNLLPACDTCNAGAAKGTKFPVEGEYAFSPSEGRTSAELDCRERPLLLHPFHGGERDPKKHICFDEFGMPHPIHGSRYGQVTIEVFQLDREDLNDDRKERFEELDDRIREAIGSVAKRLSTFDDALRAYVEADKRYSQAGKDYIKLRVPQVLGEISEQLR
jgi:hypothetical protein